MDARPERRDAIIAGVNKGGTTSLFVSLSEHPDVVPSAIKETRYFLPARYGRPLPPVAEWEGYFAGRSGVVRLEATPSYFYGGAAIARALQDVLTDPRVILVLREPVARAISFFEYQKVRLRFPEDLAIEEYLAQVDRLTEADFADPENEKYMAVRGGRYADWLSEWWDVFGPDRIRVVWFEELVADGGAVVRDLCGWLGLDPERLPAEMLRSENRTVAFRHARLQRLALRFNDSSERWLRRVPGVKRALRGLYFRLNGRRGAAPVVSEVVRADLAARFAEPNARLGRFLDEVGVARPAWLV